jgi:hypothetical protein
MIQMRDIDALGACGKPAVNALNEIINCSSINKEVRTHALNVIQSIKNNSCISSGPHGVIRLSP